jgi:hypothetical protein
LFVLDAESGDEVGKAPKIVPKKKWEGEDEEQDSAPVYLLYLKFCFAWFISLFL